MTIRSIVTERYARWAETLFKHGYMIEGNPTLPTSTATGVVGLRGRRRRDLGAPPVVIDIAEAWSEGPDPDGLGLEDHGCHLAGSGWHAQLETGDRGAERLDVDRTKPTELIIHRHPFGSSNEVRKPERDLRSPEAWVLDIEQLSALVVDLDD
jgi:hypothetical protein